MLWAVPVLGRSAGGFGGLEGGCGLVEGLGHGDDAVEAGGAEQPDQGGAVAADADVATQLSSPPDAADQGAEPGRVDERHTRHVDDQARGGGQLGESLAELADREGIQFSNRSADLEAVDLVELDVEHAEDGTRGPGAATLPTVPDVLIACDAKWVHDEVRQGLRGGDVTVRWVRTGQDAVAAVQERAPDLAVLDMQIDNMGAMAISLDLHLEEGMGRLPHVPILILLDRRPDVFLARRSGAEGFVVKPLDPIRLRKAITALLAGGTYQDDSYKPVTVAPT